MADFPAVSVQVRDFSNGEIAYTLPAYRLRSFDDLIDRTYIPLLRNPRLNEMHMHSNNISCGTKLTKEKWEAGDYLCDLRPGEQLTIWVHFVPRPGRDKHGYPLRQEEEDEEDEEDEENEEEDGEEDEEEEEEEVEEERLAAAHDLSRRQDHPGMIGMGEEERAREAREAREAWWREESLEKVQFEMSSGSSDEEEGTAAAGDQAGDGGRRQNEQRISESPLFVPGPHQDYVDAERQPESPKWDWTY
ncbi:hypothetical protein P280DRAFT_470363 [Massarina eburnea CBS 473.64]|uniref:Uncharacterized protein n=1 Tax=Massarina eburnea CBS 473.64 TaxID=1395130 RepID=A0A6A6RXM2_9PLEO|nr:hypothetical protein P280DRAFT_470363 [Massarina eburnea CBS 473.64]